MISQPGGCNAASLILVEEDLEHVRLLLLTGILNILISKASHLKDHGPLLHVPVQDIPGLRSHGDAAVLGDESVRDDCAQCGVGQCVLHLDTWCA